MRGKQLLDRIRYLENFHNRPASNRKQELDVVLAFFNVTKGYA
jgi:hypothetical protein